MTITINLQVSLFTQSKDLIDEEENLIKSRYNNFR